MARTRPIRRFKAGTAIFFRIEVRDATDETMPLFAPSSQPTIIVRDPVGNVQADFEQMTTAASETGIYTFVYQTETTDALGVWQVGFKVSDGNTVYAPEQDAFELVP